VRPFDKLTVGSLRVFGFEPGKGAVECLFVIHGGGLGLRLEPAVSVAVRIVFRLVTVSIIGALEMLTVRAFAPGVLVGIAGLMPAEGGLVAVTGAANAESRGLDYLFGAVVFAAAIHFAFRAVADEAMGAIAERLERVDCALDGLLFIQRQGAVFPREENGGCGESRHGIGWLNVSRIIRAALNSAGFI